MPEMPCLRLGRLLLAALPVAAVAVAGEPPLVKVAEFHLQHARQGAAAVVVDDVIYVLGGGAGPAITHVERFDTRTTATEVLPSKLRPRRYHAAFAHEGRIHLFGGQGYGRHGDIFESAVEIYDPATGEIGLGPVMPRPGANMASARLGSRAYFIGGARKHGSIIGIGNSVDIFDFATGEWSNGPAMPTPRESRAVTVGSFILVPGGFRRPRGTTEVEMFVPAENAWKPLPPLSRRMSANSLVFLGEHLFLFSDYDDLDTVLAYNLRTRESHGFTLPGYRGARHAAAVVCRDRIYVIGGNRTSESGDETDRIQVFALNPRTTAP